MTDRIVEYTDFSSDVSIAIGAFSIEQIVVKDAGSGGLVLRGRWGDSTLTGLVDDEIVSVNATLILAVGTSVAKLRVFYRKAR